jgi:uncharacterized protein YutE (UPF0331/DUF86 family)
MTEYSTIENKISSIKKYLAICRTYHTFSQAEIENDVNTRGMVERYLYLVVQSTIDLAESYISFKHYRKPSTMAESFHILKEENIIDTDLCSRLINMTGFRNVVAHDYEKINYTIVFKVLHDGLIDIEEFLTHIK